MKTNIKQSLIAATAIVAFSVFAGCSGGGGGGGDSTTTDAANAAAVNHDNDGSGATGTSLLCQEQIEGDYSTLAATVTADDHITKVNISTEGEGLYPQPHQERSNAHNILARLWTVAPALSADGNASTVLPEGTEVHPLVIAYAEQVIGDYAMNDGSADIGDPYHVDDIFTSVSLDNGHTWKKVNLSKTAGKSSTEVKWDADVENHDASPTLTTIEYPGHSHKPSMAIKGNRILVAWNDKYCPSGNPLDLAQVVDGEGNTTYPDDLYKVNGSQGSIDYNLDCSIPDDESTKGIDESNCAPNGNEVYEVPFSCVWTARGIFNTDTNEVDWHQAKQLTSATRDSNKIWITASKDVGFAMAWQEDPEGLREGKGAGPGEGWSGATTNHGADIWYSYISMADFDDINTTVVEGEEDDNETKPKSLNNLSYPVRVTDNEVCKEGDTKLYCQQITCVDYINTKDEDFVEGAEDGTNTSEKCVTGTLDPLLAGGYSIYEDGSELVILDGDTGASRPALTIAVTDQNEPVVLLAYEETKGLADNSGDGEPTQGDADEETDIELEGKVVYFESFMFDNPVTVSPGSIVNLRVPEQETGDMIFENARRVVIINQVEECDATETPFGLMFKQGVETQGGSSDMFIRLNTGFDYATFRDTVTNVSAMDPVFEDGADDNATPIASTWTVDNLDDMSYENLYENTFSPRAFLRGDDLYTGFEYSPNFAQTEQGNVPNNFYINRFIEGEWKGPQNISMVYGRKTSTLDPRFIPAPESIPGTDIPSDVSNPNVIFMTFGTFDMETGDEADLFFTRSTDKGETWERVDINTSDDNSTLVNAKLSARQLVQEKEVQSLASPDGTMLFNAWLQEELPEDYIDPSSETPEPFKGLDSWMGRVDYNVTDPVE